MKKTETTEPQRQLSDITDLVELKAIAYDLLANREQVQAQLEAVNQQILKVTKESE